MKPIASITEIAPNEVKCRGPRARARSRLMEWISELWVNVFFPSFFFHFSPRCVPCYYGEPHAMHSWTESVYGSIFFLQFFIELRQLIPLNCVRNNVCRSRSLFRALGQYSTTNDYVDKFYFYYFHIFRCSIQFSFGLVFSMSLLVLIYSAHSHTDTVAHAEPSSCPFVHTSNSHNVRLSLPIRKTRKKRYLIIIRFKCVCRADAILSHCNFFRNSSTVWNTVHDACCGACSVPSL